jgi:hypothetical protein
MTIIESIVQVMTTAATPMTPKEVLEAIRRLNLYAFKTKTPMSVVRAQMRIHCIDYAAAAGARVRYLDALSNNRFALLPKPVVMGPDSSMPR